MYVVIGANGQVGQEFVHSLKSQDALFLTHEQIEVSAPESLAACFRGITCSAIINLAAFHNVNACEDDPERAFRINAVGAARVAEVAQSLGCRVVFFSTDYVFGQDSRRRSVYLESDPLAPLNTYGASKAAGELMVRAACPNHLIVRTSSVFGAVSSRKGATFPEMILRRARAGERLRVVNDQFMAPTYAPDLVASVLALLEAGATGTIHITNGGVCSWYEFASATLRDAAIDYEPEPVSSNCFPARAKRPAFSAMASERISAWNIQPLRSWQSALKAYLAETGAVTTGLSESCSRVASAPEPPQ
jgi:dTDP-4-dehydrorhamnose reductase